MAYRYRLIPTPAQEKELTDWCAQTRYVWNLGLEQRNFWRRGMKRLTAYDQQLELAEARATNEWLASGPSVIQQQAISDLDRAFRNWWRNPRVFRRPTWRRKGINEGFHIRDVRVKHLSGKRSSVHVPKLGYVPFRLHRSLSEDYGMAHVNLDKSGRWWVTFNAVPNQVSGPRDGSAAGIDRGVANTITLSTGEHGHISQPDWKKRARLQRSMERQQMGSNRRERTKRRHARLMAKEADRRKDWVEKTTTELARTYDLIVLEDLPVKRMMKSAKGTRANPSTNVSAKRGLNRSIKSQNWGMFQQRLKDKIGDRLVLVPPRHTSTTCSSCGNNDREQRESQARFVCRSCGYKEHADVNAARNILALGQRVTGRGGREVALVEASTTERLASISTPNVAVIPA